jgi:RimJ/RimL family protein N-acetyltransferase
MGSAGYKGPPSADATLEVGYGIVSEYQRQGYASEVVHGFLAHAFALPAVHRVVAETLPSLVPSIGVLRKCGFRLIWLRARYDSLRAHLARVRVPERA